MLDFQAALQEWSPLSLSGDAQQAIKGGV